MGGGGKLRIGSSLDLRLNFATNSWDLGQETSRLWAPEPSSLRSLPALTLRIPHILSPSQKDLKTTLHS